MVLRHIARLKQIIPQKRWLDPVQLTAASRTTLGMPEIQIDGVEASRQGPQRAALSYSSARGNPEGIDGQHEVNGSASRAMRGPFERNPAYQNANSTSVAQLDGADQVTEGDGPVPKRRRVVNGRPESTSEHELDECSMGVSQNVDRVAEVNANDGTQTQRPADLATFTYPSALGVQGFNATYRLPSEMTSQLSAGTLDGTHIFDGVGAQDIAASVCPVSSLGEIGDPGDWATAERMWYSTNWVMAEQEWYNTSQVGWNECLPIS